MKPAACILIFLWTALLLEPAFAHLTWAAEDAACFKSNQSVKSSCVSSCTKEDESEKSEKNNDCEKNRCNPLMSCPTGNFYVVGQPHISVTPFKISKQKTILVNDNRISEQLSECWHPPEIV